MNAATVGSGGRAGDRSAPSRQGVARGDLLLALAAVALLAAASYPRVEQTLMARQADAAGDAVEAVRVAVRSFLREGGGWPEGAPLGTVPEALQGHLPEDFSFRRAGFALQWERWEAPGVKAAAPALPDSVPPPPPPVVTLGAITVVSEDPRILAALLERFGATRSFVKDSGWTLVLTREGPP